MYQPKINLDVAIIPSKLKDYLSKRFRVESINTGRQWCFETVKELESFFLGRNRNFYRVFENKPLNR